MKLNGNLLIRLLGIILALSLGACASTEPNPQEDLEVTDQGEDYEGDDEELADDDDDFELDEGDDEELADDESFSDEALNEVVEEINSPDGEEVVEEVEEVMEEPADALAEAEASLDQEPMEEIAEVEPDEVVLASEMPDTIETTEVVSEGQMDPDATVGSYVTRPGDSLSQIAGRIYGDPGRWRDLAEQNNLSNPDRIFPGDVIEYRNEGHAKEFSSRYASLPRSQVTVQAGDSLAKISQRIFGTTTQWRVLWSYNKDRISNPNVIEVGTVLTYVNPKRFAQL